jgi:dolichyl-phosphate beta-glucosyltransferase
MDLSTVFAVLLSVVACLFVALAIVRAKFGERCRPVWRPEPEETVFERADGTTGTFPLLTRDAATIDLSVVVPAYNERNRIAKMLHEAQAVLKEWPGESEIVVVDDGSRDGTAAYVRETFPSVRVLALPRNCGKGGAVRRGMLVARGQLLLMADADGATAFHELRRLRAALPPGGVALGSRAHVQAAATAQRSVLRNALMRAFHLVVRAVGVHGIGDTQCGFKLSGPFSPHPLFFSSLASYLLFLRVMRGVGDCFQPLCDSFFSQYSSPFLLAQTAF